MNFSEKLYKLRKEKGMSQEELAEKLNTSRQAISKWENSQGYPETEKILMLGNIFEVSMDYLLKDGEELLDVNRGYYVSKEMAYSYLANEKKLMNFVAMGVSTIVLSGVPYVVLQEHRDVQIISMAIFITIAIAFVVTGALKEVDTYKVLKQEPLLFDKQFHAQLTKEYQSFHKRSSLLLGIGIMMIVIGFIPILLVVKDFMSEDAFTTYHAICFFLMAIGMFCFITSSAMMEAYQLLVHNEAHMKKISVRILRKFRNLIEDR